MRRLLPLILLPGLLGQAPGVDPSKARRERLVAIYRGEAGGYAISRGAGRPEPLRLRAEPVYVWTNPIRGGEQDGAVFVWTARGKAEAIGTFFSYPATGPRHLNHELHSLSMATLTVSRPGGAHTWEPKAPGVEPRAIPSAAAPAAAPGLRLIQMRELTRGFSAASEDFEGKKYELRLLPQPLFRYESTDPDVLDGAVFAFVTSAGTDPEVILVIEARKPPASDAPSWHYSVARFSDLSLTVRLKGSEVFAAGPIPHDAPEADPLQRYRTFRDRDIPPIEEATP